MSFRNFIRSFFLILGCCLIVRGHVTINWISENVDNESALPASAGWHAQLIWSPDAVPSGLNPSAPFMPTGGEVVLFEQALNTLSADGYLLGNITNTIPNVYATGYVYTRVFNVNFPAAGTPTLYAQSAEVDGPLVAGSSPVDLIVNYHRPSLLEVILPLNALSDADLSLVLAPFSDPAPAGTRFAYTLAASNAGPAVALAPLVALNLPGELVPSGIISTHLNDLLPGDTHIWQVFVEVRTNAVGPLIVSATIQGSGSDSNVLNNAATSLVQVVDTDSDFDRMPDAWENLHQLNPLDPTDALIDTDHDGALNVEEFIADTIPTNNLSVFRIQLTGSAGSFFLEAPSSAGRVYTTWTRERSTNTWQLLEKGRPGTGNLLSIPISFFTDQGQAVMEVLRPLPTP